MNTKQRKLLSPLLSVVLIIRIISLPQVLTSTKDSLSSYSISTENTNKQNNKYNRTSLLLMPNYLFWYLLIEITCNTYPAEVKSKLKSIMKQKTTDSRIEFNDQASNTMLSDTVLFKESSWLMEFFLALNKEYTILSLKAFMLCYLLLLIDEYLKRKSKCSPKQQKPMSPKVLKLLLESIRKPSIQRSNHIEILNVHSTR